MGPRLERWKLKIPVRFGCLDKVDDAMGPIQPDALCRRPLLQAPEGSRSRTAVLQS